MTSTEYKLNNYFNAGLFTFAAVAPFSNAAMEITIAYLTVVWFVRMYVEKRIIFKLTNFTVIFLIYLFIIVVSGLFSIHPLNSAALVGEEWIALLYFAIVNNLTSPKVFLKSLRVLAVSCSIVGIYAIWQHFTGLDLTHDTMLIDYGDYYRAAGFFGLCLTFGGLYILAYIPILGSIFGAGRLKDKLIYGIPSVIMFFAIIASYSRNAWVGSALGSIPMAFFYHWKTGAVYLVIFLAVWTGIFFLHPSLIENYGVRSIADSSQDTGIQGRLMMLDRGFEMIKKRPFFGVGMGNIVDYKNEFYWPEQIRRFGNLHNDIVTIAVQIGIFGGFAFIGMWLIFFGDCLSYFKREIRKNKHIAAAVLGSAGGILGILIAGAFQCHYTDIEVGMIWWFIAGLASAIALLPPDVETGEV